MKNSGFTLIEILLVVAALAILAGIVIFAINPGKQLAETRNAQRLIDVSTIYNALYQYSVDHRGGYPSIIDTDWRMIGTATSGCGISCGESNVQTTEEVNASFTDESILDFDLGVYNNLLYNSGIELNLCLSGNYESEIKAVDQDVDWQQIKFTTLFPANKELPDNNQSETGYLSGNANMSDNSLLFHMNESAGDIQDFSNNENQGRAYDGIVYQKDGIFKKALEFSNDAYLQVVDNDFNFSQNGTVEAWIYPYENNNDFAGIVHKGILKSFDDEVFTLQLWEDEVRFAICDENNNYAIVDSGVAFNYNAWNHIVGTWDANTIKIYLNGVLVQEKNHHLTLKNNLAPIQIGTQIAEDYNASYGKLGFNGLIDEVAIFKRTLSEAEINYHYKRGVDEIKYQVRACEDQTCSGEIFVGPDGSADSYFSEIDSSELTPVIFNLNLDIAPYFQYKVYMNSLNLLESPILKKTEIDYSYNKVGDMLNEGVVFQDECLNLEEVLVPDYLVSLPRDPILGEEEQTFYAIKKENGKIKVKACFPELEEEIKIDL